MNGSGSTSAISTTPLRKRSEIQQVAAAAFDNVVEIFGDFELYDFSKRSRELLRILNDFAANKFHEPWKRVENSSLAKNLS